MKLIKAIAAITTSFFFLSGCTSLSTGGISNPTPIHMDGKLPSVIDDNNLEQKAISAEAALGYLYYDSLNIAKAPNASPEEIKNYVKTGTKLVETYCVRWFRKLGDAQRKLEFSNNNRNVISQLGTALIGVGRLHSDLTAAYGATNVAMASFSENVNASFLIAPNSENVKNLVMQAVKARSDQLNNASSAALPKDFPTAYADLEQMADICTYAEAKKMATQAVDNSKAEVNNETGQVLIVSAASKMQASVNNHIESLITKIDSLNTTQALALSSVMPFKNDSEIKVVIAASDPKNNRFSDQKAAKLIAKRVMVLTAKSAEAIDKWEAVLMQLD